MRRGAEVVGEDGVLAVLAFVGEAFVAAMQTAWPLQAPVPAAGRLEQVAAERSCIAQLRARGEPAGLAQRRGDPSVAFELRERRPGADHVSVDPVRHDPANVDESLGTHDSAAQERHELGAAVQRRPAVELEARRLPELQPSPSPSPRPRAARAASPRGRSAAGAPPRPSRHGSRSRSPPPSG